MSRKSQSKMPKDVPKEQPKEDNKEDLSKINADQPIDNQDLAKSQNADGNEKQQNQTGGKFQSLPLREYYDSSLSSVLLEGLRELGRQRPENPIQFLGLFLLDHDPEKNKK